MFLTWLGWIVLIVISFGVTVLWAFVSWDTFGKYNIGGVRNGLGVKFRSAVLTLLPILAWWITVSQAPFSIVLN